MNQTLDNFFTTGKVRDSVFTPQIISNLKMVESSGNPNAFNPVSGAEGLFQFIPSTTKYLSKKYGAFNPRDPEQAEAMAIRYLEDLYDQTGSVEGALARYGGYVTKDPTNYIKKIMGPPIGKQREIQVASTNNDALDDFFSQGAAPKERPTQKQVPPSKNVAQQPPVTAPQSAPATSAPAIQSNSSNPIADFGKGLVSLADAPLEGLSSLSSQFAYPVARLFTDDQRAQQLTAPIKSPIGKALGIENDPAYQGEISRQVLGFIGENVNKGAEWISEKTGIPVNDVSNMMGSLGLALPKVASASRPAVSQAASSLAQKFKRTSNGNIDFSKLPEAPRQNFDKNASFEETKYAEKSLPMEKQVERAQILKRVGFDSINENVLKGRGTARSTDAAVANTDTPLGRHLKEQINSEKNTLNKYAEGLLDDTNGIKGTDQSSMIARGRNILKPLEEFETYYKTKISDMYNRRHAEAANIPVYPEKTLEVLGRESLTEVHQDALSLAKGVKGRMKELGIMDKDGNIVDTDAKKMELLRQYVGENYSPRSTGLYKELRQAIDDDVFDYSNSSLYAENRALVVEMKNALENPKGIKNLLEEEGINRRVNFEKVANNVSTLPAEQLRHIVDTLENAPPEIKASAQASLDNIKAEFLNRIIQEGNKNQGNVSQWNARGVTKYLNSYSENLKIVFTPEELAKIADLNDAGHIIKTDTGYKGAAVQGINVRKKGLVRGAIEQGLGVGAEAAAVNIGIPPTGLIKQGVSNLLEKRSEAKFIEKQLKQEEKKMIPLNRVGKGSK